MPNPTLAIGWPERPYEKRETHRRLVQLKAARLLGKLVRVYRVGPYEEITSYEGILTAITSELNTADKLFHFVASDGRCFPDYTHFIWDIEEVKEDK